MLAEQRDRQAFYQEHGGVPRDVQPLLGIIVDEYITEVLDDVSGTAATTVTAPADAVPSGVLSASSPAVPTPAPSDDGGCDDYQADTDSYSILSDDVAAVIAATTGAVSATVASSNPNGDSDSHH